MTSTPLARSRTAPDALEAYRAGSFFFASPIGSLAAEGVHGRVRVSGPPALVAAAARAALERAKADGVEDPIVVGALPFAPGAATELLVPRVVRRGPPIAAGPVAHPAGEWSVDELPAAADYEAGVREMLRRIDRGELEKAVLARALDLRGAGPVDPKDVLAALARRDTHAYAFAAPLGDGGTFVGASPELLVRRAGRDVLSIPLAGSASREDDAEADSLRAARLAESTKDRHEHAFVVAAVGRGLEPFCEEVAVPAAPSLVRTPVVWHLSSRVSGRLREPATGALELAAALHPTPAVCGEPREAALAAIAELEPFDRGLYGGAVGWCDADGDGEWAVAIRCAEIRGERLRLFAGAGIVDGSRPAEELAETAAKFGTMTAALGVRRTAAEPATPRDQVEAS